MGPSTRRSPDIEEQLRSMMHRRAAHMRPRRPDWNVLEFDLGELRLEPARTGGVPSDEERKRQLLARARPFAAAAAVLVVVLAGAVVLDLASSGGGQDAADGEEAANATTPPTASVPDTIPHPGSEQFDRYLATPIYPVTDHEQVLRQLGDEATADAVGMTRAYLRDSGIADDLEEIRTVEVDIALDQGESEPEPEEWARLGDVSMAWSTWGEPGSKAITSGNVYLRRASWTSADSQRPNKPWVVVGARAEGIVLKEVRRDGEQVSFQVDRDEDETAFRIVRVEVNDRVIKEGEVGLDGPESFLVDVAAGEVAVIRLQHLGTESHPVSIAAMAVSARS